MSNYPNMSYCMCENTVLAVRQVLTAMNEEGLGFMVDMNRDEKRAFKELFALCEDFLIAAEELEAEYENECDGQPNEAQEWHDFDPDC